MTNATSIEIPKTTVKRIHYKKGYKYQLAHDYLEHIPVQPEHPIKTEFIRLDQFGNLVVLRGYAWDGPSGPAPDLDGFMRGSLKHDALYQLMRMGLLSPEQWRKTADEIFRRDCKIDGLWGWLAQVAYKSIRSFGSFNAETGQLKQIEIAPKP